MNSLDAEEIAPAETPGSAGPPSEATTAGERSSADASRAPRASREIDISIVYLAVVGALVLFFIVNAMVATRESFLDDAFISFRYARNLVEGHGLVYNVGQRVEGYTNFSWVILSALVLALGLEPHVVMPFVGLASGVVTVVATAVFARKMAAQEGEAPHAYAGVVGAAVVAGSTNFAYWSSSGLETGLFTMLYALGGFCVVLRRPRAFAILTGLAFLSRPEAGLLGVLGIAWFVWLWRRGAAAGERAANAGGPVGEVVEERRLGWRDVRDAVLILAALTVPYVAWKFVYFGSVIPNTAVAKPPDRIAGLEDTALNLLDLAGPLIAAIGTLASRRRNRSRTLLLALWATQMASVPLLEGADWMPFHRLTLPSLPWLAAAIDATILDWFTLPRSAARAGRLALGLLTLAYFPQSLLDHREIPKFTTWKLESKAFQQLIADMKRRGPQRVGTMDIGVFGWECSGCQVVDLGGLTDRAIARLPGTHFDRAFTPEVFAGDREPDGFLFTLKSRDPIEPYYPSESNIVNLPWFKAHYRPIAGIDVKGYWLVWFGKVPRHAGGEARPSP